MIVIITYLNHLIDKKDEQRFVNGDEDFLNQVLRKCWPFVYEKFSIFIEEFVEHFNKNNNIKIGSLSIGSVIPEFLELKSERNNDPNYLSIVLDVDYKGDAYFELNYSGLSVGVKDITWRCFILVQVKFGNIIEYIEVSLLKKPIFNYNLTGLLDIMDITGFNHIINMFLREFLFSRLVSPNKYLLYKKQDNELLGKRLFILGMILEPILEEFDCIVKIKSLKESFLYNFKKGSKCKIYHQMIIFYDPNTKIEFGIKCYNDEKNVKFNKVILLKDIKNNEACNFTMNDVGILCKFDEPSYFIFYKGLANKYTYFLFKVNIEKFVHIFIEEDSYFYIFLKFKGIEHFMGSFKKSDALKNLKINSIVHFSSEVSIINTMKYNILVKDGNNKTIINQEYFVNNNKYIKMDLNESELENSSIILKARIYYIKGEYKGALENNFIKFYNIDEQNTIENIPINKVLNLDDFFEIPQYILNLSIKTDIPTVTITYESKQFNLNSSNYNSNVIQIVLTNNHYKSFFEFKFGSENFTFPLEDFIETSKVPNSSKKWCKDDNIIDFLYKINPIMKSFNLETNYIFLKLVNIQICNLKQENLATFYFLIDYESIKDENTKNIINYDPYALKYSGLYNNDTKNTTLSVNDWLVLSPPQKNQNNVYLYMVSLKDNKILGEVKISLKDLQLKHLYIYEHKQFEKLYKELYSSTEQLLNYKNIEIRNNLFVLKIQYECFLGIIEQTNF